MSHAHQTLKEMEAELLDRRSKVEALLAERQGAAARILDIDESIERITGEPASKYVREAEIAAITVRLGDGDKSPAGVKEYIRQALNSASCPLTLEQVTAKVLEAGYATDATNFGAVVYKAIYRDPGVKRVPGTSTYRLSDRLQ